MNQETVIQAIQTLGQRLNKTIPAGSRVTIFVVGGVAGLLTRRLGPDRTTADCDVMAVEPAGFWELVRREARIVGAELGLGEDWLNRDSAMFAWQMPLGWQQRCEEHAAFGPLRVLVISRFDLIASKVMAAPKRPQDREDLLHLKPTKAELRQLEQHLDRIDS